MAPHRARPARHDRGLRAERPVRLCDRHRHGRARGGRGGRPAHRQAVREVHRQPEVPEPPARRAEGDRPGHARAGSLITICEVGPRDGLQNEHDVVSPVTRAELINRLGTTGVQRIEAVSFVRDDAVPQMAGAEEVVAAIETRDGVEYSGLVLNEKGYERFVATPLDRINVTLGATEAFNQRNGNASLDDARARVGRMLAAAEKPATVTISVAFGCPFEGKVDPAVVEELAAEFEAAE